MATCGICKVRKIDVNAERMRGFCDECSDRTGIWWSIESIPPLRPAKPCVRCNHPQLVRSLMRETRGYGNGSVVAPMGLAYDVTEFWGNPTANDRAPQGAVVAYACLQCGFTELYTWLPHLVPIGPQFGTEIVDVSTSLDAGPFR